MKVIIGDLKIIVGKALTCRYSNRNRFFSTTKSSKRKPQEPSMAREVRIHIFEFHQKQIRCHYCKNESSDLRYFVSFQVYGLYLCLTKEIKCFLKHHLQFFITILLLITYLLENRLFLCRFFRFLLCLLCSRICRKLFKFIEQLKQPMRIPIQFLLKTQLTRIIHKIYSDWFLTDQ